MRVWLFGPQVPCFEDPSVHVDVIPPAPEPDDEPDEIAEYLEALEKRQDKIEEKIDTCLTKLEQLSTATNSESPQLAALQTEIVNLRGELATVKSLADSMLNRLTQSESAPPTTTPAVVEPSAELLIEEPSLDDSLPQTQTPQPERKKNRFI